MYTVLNEHENNKYCDEIKPRIYSLYLFVSAELYTFNLSLNNRRVCYRLTKLMYLGHVENMFFHIKFLVLRRGNIYFVFFDVPLM